MKKRTLQILKYLLFLGLGVFLVWWSLQQIPPDKWDDFKEAFSTARYLLLLPVFFILLFSHFLRAVRWKMLILPLGHNPSITNTFFAVMIGYLANLAVPRLGEVLKCTILAKYENVPADKLLGTIFAERAFDMLCLILVFVLAFVLQFRVIGDFGIGLLKRLFVSDSGTFNTTKFAIAIAILVVVASLIAILLKRYSNFKIISVVRNIIKGIWQGIISIKDMKQKWSFIFASAGIWLMYLLGTWIGFYATAGTAGSSLATAVSTLAFASVGMIITPGGIGAYPVLLAKVLELHNIPYAIGLANGTLQWFAQFLIILFVGFICLGLLPYYNKKTKHHEKARDHSI